MKVGRAVLPCASLLLAACGASESTAPKRLPLLQIVEGAGTSDTIQAKQLQALVVEVRDSTGTLKRGAVVRFDAVPVPPPRNVETGISVAKLTLNTFGPFAADSADLQGRAKTLVQFGTVAGTQRIAISVPELGVVDTASFTVLPGSATRVTVKVRDTVVYANQQYGLGAVATDRAGNARPSDPITYVSGPSVASVSPSGSVTSGTEGRGWIAVAAGAARDTARLSVVPHGSLVFLLYQNASWSIATADLDGSNLKSIAPVSGSSAYPWWDKAGSRIIFHEGDEYSTIHVYILDPATGRRQALIPASSPILDDAWGRFSPDGQWVYFSGKKSGEIFGLYRIHPDGSALEQVIPTPAYGVNWRSAISADGSTLTFVTTGTIIETADIASRTVKNLNVNGQHPHFTPDGASITWIGQYAGGLHIMNRDGTNQRLLSPAGRAYDESAGYDVSPDGAWVVVRGAGTLELLRISDGMVLPLKYSAGFYQPAFHP